MRKQATLPEGALSLGLAGTAPGVVLDADGCVVVVLPGPPRELQRLWPRALETEPVRRVLERAPAARRTVLRFFGTPESAVAKALAEAGGDGDGVEATICAREFEIHVDLVVEPGAEERADEVADVAPRSRSGRYLFGEDERSIAEIVLDLCRARGLTLATAESCTGGLVAARLTAVPGSSDVFRRRRRRVRERREARRARGPGGGPRASTARSRRRRRAAMAQGARERLGADVGRRGDGRRRARAAGPRRSPSGLVFVHAVGPDGEEARRTELPATGR